LWLQLNRKKHIKTAVATFAAALLGSGAIAGAQSSSVESSLLLYSETSRIKAAEGIVSYSPNGAAPSDKIQTFTRPSGSGSYQTQAGEIPLDDTFRDTRYAIDGNFRQPLNRVTDMTIGGHFSGEHDYSSFGLNAGLTRDFNRRNTTLGASVSFSHDKVSPEGGAPIPLSSMQPPGENGEDVGHENEGGEFEDDDDGGGSPGKNKNVLDALIGFNQVLDRKTIFRFNYSFSHSAGYLNDPYKLISIVQNENSASPGEPVEYLYESRPESHNKHALYSELRRYLGGNTVNLSYRYFWDNWGITSQTVDLSYLWHIRGSKTLQPHLRWYHQNRADFYRTYLADNDPLPQHVSADYRLAKYDALTAGLQYSFLIGKASRISLTAEHYSQFGDRSPPEAIGILKNYDMFPDLKAIMFRIGFSSDF
jgi:hypothetical protein